MIITDIEIKIKTDHSLEPEEQEYHEVYIAHFRHEFTKWLEKSGIRSNTPVRFNIYYLATQRLFYINDISSQKSLIFSFLKDDIRFYTKYFTNTIISSADNE
ncbi:hypothetical protein G6N05_05320 [Flavobacterium sp. F372]|uniref:Uncharacterized protein n=1 Tax=Flavobacterium bernardetii TaxID=2813823 RepID=A0ABR7J183_9FLAO|nr:hypothetical protein [Flavobacterium bernardetii]MBC5835800.1 hypothetical protein [Flavobacterium bernardetii]NHF69531.1 hypothetical protein [Flavobacterium bernardetii]